MARAPMRAPIIVAGVLSMALGTDAIGFGGPSGMRRLTTSELKAFVVGAVVTQDVSRSGMRSTDRGEVFKRDGSYIRLGDRARTDGTYAIEAGRICIRLPAVPAQDCRVIEVDASGAMFFARLPPASDARPWPIMVRRPPAGGSEP